MPVIHWFRRDLRITDNTALTAAARSSDEVITVYVMSGWSGSHSWTGAPRQGFLCGCLRSLADNLAAIGGCLVVRRGDAVAELEKLLVETKAGAIYFNRDPDPFGRETERRVAEMVRRHGAAAHGFKDIAIHEQDEIFTSAGGPYRVFTPYARVWMNTAKPPVQPAIRKLTTLKNVPALPLPRVEDWGLPSPAQIPEAGEKAARKRLADFLRGRIFDYGTGRDMPSAEATSRLSADLRFGTISVREIHAKCIQVAAEAEAPGRKSAVKFIQELIWREFYMQILWHYPEVLGHEFNPAHRDLKWKRAGKQFLRWCHGETGFPIVDAGMRQLNATGYMHNRLRMIVAMFLTKDLHIDWREGERYFMQRLIDGDIASNNGGWQWSAGTGADAAPYFRIQNPWTQAARYDPEGAYIKRWVPELCDVPAAKLFQPPGDGGRLVKNYPPPMADHARERQATLEMFASLRFHR